jgi:processive 1,2-diacylglycerol beta-glucosyltransferase
MRMKPKFIILYEHGSSDSPHGSAYIRLINPLTYPTLNDKYDFEFKTEYLGDRCNAIILDRLWRPDISLNFAKSLLNDIRRRGIKFIYSCDDNFLDLPLSRNGWFTQEKIDIVKFFLSAAYQVWVTTPQLANRFKDYSKNIYVIPNYFDDRLIKNLPPKKRDSSIFRIGYMGTYTHLDDLEIISGALNKIGKKYLNKVEFQIIGIGDKNDIERILPGIKITHFNINEERSIYKNFIAWFSSTFEWQIALAPLNSSPLNICKSDLKFLDYSLIHSLGIYSDLTPYNTSENIINSVTGIIVKNESYEWYYAINELINKPSLLNYMADNAYVRFKDFCTLKNGIDKWDKVLEKTL